MSREDVLAVPCPVCTTAPGSTLGQVGEPCCDVGGGRVQMVCLARIDAARATPQTPAATTDTLCRDVDCKGHGVDHWHPQTPIVDPGVCASWCGDIADGATEPGYCTDACTAARRSLNPHPSRHEGQSEFSPAPWVCAAWCGNDRNAVKLLRPLPDSWSRRNDNERRSYCTPACRDAGRPLKPRPRASTGRAVRPAREVAHELICESVSTSWCRDFYDGTGRPRPGESYDAYHGARCDDFTAKLEEWIKADRAHLETPGAGLASDASLEQACVEAVLNGPAGGLRQEVATILAAVDTYQRGSTGK